MATSVVHARLAATVSILALCIAAPALAQTAPDGATAIDDIIVTAQKREESIQDVPIAVSAFSAETLDAMKIEGGSELLRAIPNVSFSKNNFSMYNFSIRGIGTKAVSASSDPAVAVSFNNAPMIRNRLFESEYMDVNRVEVLRGPQGTLYGRNATAGVVNMIPNLPGPDFDAMLKAEVGNFGTTRGQMMLNIPLSDTFWVRGAASVTKRDGFDRNTFKDTDVNGRDLYSTRLAAAWEPNDRFSANFIWEHFGEDDNRSRTGKNLCTRDSGPAQIGSVTITDEALRGKLSQGCSAGSLYSDAAYQTPNGNGMASVLILSQSLSLGLDANPALGGVPVYAMKSGDPYSGVVQSRNLREISTGYDPIYQAKNDIFQLNLKYGLTDNVTLHSQTLYTSDKFWASQDYARYVSNPVFSDSDGLFDVFGNPIFGSTISPGGFYDDPQLGRSNRMLSADISEADNDQFYQEFRIQSEGDGRFNFNLGANYLKFNTEDNYYVFNNTFSMMAEYFYGPDNSKFPAIATIKCEDGSVVECVYVDYSPLRSIAGDGHNYFRSKNVVKTESSAIFGEAYIDLTEQVRLTLGGRFTHDKKVTTPYPSQLLLGYSDTTGGIITGGSVVRGLVAAPDIEQKWDALTGRAVLDWKPSEDMMFYASLARGYKGGGVNPPRADINPAVVQYQPLPEQFEPEYVTSFEIGSKMNLLDGTLRLNTTAFYYKYTDYQVSQIVDRISLNENFDAESMGLEFEAIWRPTRNFRVDANLGYLKTKIGKGEESIDVMNRTQGNSDWVVVRPWVQVPSNCIAPKQLVEDVLGSPFGPSLWLYALSAMCGGSVRVGSFDPNFPSYLPLHAFFGVSYNPLTDAPNGGRGFAADLSGNELPNAPNFTGNIGAQYTFNLSNWDLTVRGDYYRQSESYFRVYNTEYDRLKGWGSANLSVTFENYDTNVSVQAYVKNIFDDAPIVDAFTNSDDTMLTTNVFTLDPRVFGFSIKKGF
ncbi:MAG: TonB-dependent receptor [Candidatus Brevundimonas phytovorans]|nr:TonB-dependent receptor [Brevundimonas sp.]WEK58621.1 MAG: TonB-dependent receptor [Brevundimonas sp.]